ncbi:MAG: MarR family winged helix-turn-helix transcriptional regulator [Mycobacterium sp.]|uniref:MarR family winged helix-turn-helix transcriptional regulator n=1 Tax=Mycobacterium sp. TaxID=1785 RepID=UPI003F968344
MTSDRNRDDYHIEELRDALVQISFALMAVLTEVAAEHNLSLTQLRMLGILRDREPTMADLATFTGLERSTVSGLIDRAAQRGLVAKTADPHDGRSVRVKLTEPARRLVPEITADVGSRIAPLTGQLSTGEQKRLTALLSKALALGTVLPLPTAPATDSRLDQAALAMLSRCSASPGASGARFDEDGTEGIR